MVLEGVLTVILVIVLAIVISSLPLYIAVHMLGGEASILKVFLTNILIGIAIALISREFVSGLLVIIVVTIGLYSFMFKLGILKALIAWILQYVVAIALVFIATLIFGISLGMGFLPF